MNKNNSSGNLLIEKIPINHFLLIMRTTIFLLFTCVFCSMAELSYTQNARVTINKRNATIKEILNEIEKQTDYLFIYNDEINANEKVSVKAKQEAVSSVLNSMLEDKDIKYSMEGNHIILFVETVDESAEDTNVLVVQQQRIVTGKVTDQNGEPLPGATVMVKGTTQGTITDADGNYSLSNVSDDATLVFSFVGMETQEINVGNRTRIDVTLQEEAIALEEVVAIGYGTLSKRNVSGSITNLTEKDFNKGAIRNAAELLQGRVAGLMVTTETGDITAGQTMRLRGTSSLTGSSSPFIVIDGVPGMDLSSVAPQDIESISILKDASAVAIYGSRSASGVILITTKKGKTGLSTINYNSYIAIDVPSGKPELLSASQWREYTKDMDVTGIDLGANTDWFDEIMRTGVSQSHNISISGGLQDGNYRASINYLDRQGIMKDNSLERYNTLFSVNKKILNGKLNLVLNGGSMLSNDSPTNPYNTVLAYNMLPVYPVKNEDGSWFSIQEWDQGNPVHNIEANSNIYKNSLLYGNIKADLELFRGLEAGINLFKQRNSSDQSQYNNSTTQAGRQDRGYAHRGNQMWNKELLETTLKYTLNTENHKINLLGGYSYEFNTYQSVDASNRAFISDKFEYNNLSAGENLLPTDVSSYKNMNKLISFFGRINYVFNEKYIITATVRRDGSSKFGKNNKWGTFPSVSGAWRLSDESFIRDLNVFDDLKLRIGYGVVGNQDGIGPYTSIALYSRSEEYFDNGKWRNAFKYAQNDNPALKWEKTSSFNPGLDFSVLNGRLSGSVDYYIKKTSDLLYVYDVPVPPYLYSTMLANVGDISNEGIEIELSAQIIKNQNFKWSANLNFAHNKNIVERLSNDLFQVDNIKTGGINLRGSGYLTSHIIEEGQEVGTFYNLRCLGLDDDGKFIIDDINDDGTINNLDYTYIGHAMPRFTYGLMNSFQYKNWDLSFFIRGLYGNDVINNPRVQYSNPKWLPGGNVLAEVLTNGIKDDPLFSSYFIEDGSFLRMDNVNLSYNFGAFDKIGIKEFRVSATAQNLFIITSFKGVDPEVRMSGLDPGRLENDFVPKPRTFSFGIDVKF